MNKPIRVLVLLASFGLWVPPVLAEVKVAFVDAAKVLQQAPQAEAATARIEREFAPRNRELVSLQKEIRRLEDKLLRDAAIMKEQEAAKLEQNVRSKKRNLKRQQDEFREDLTLRRNEELQKLQRKVLETIQLVAERGKYDLVFSDGVVYASKRVNITPRVLEWMKKESKTSGKRSSKK